MKYHPSMELGPTNPDRNSRFIYGPQLTREVAKFNPNHDIWNQEMEKEFLACLSALNKLFCS